MNKGKEALLGIIASSCIELGKTMEWESRSLKSIKRVENAKT